MDVAKKLEEYRNNKFKNVKEKVAVVNKIQDEEATKKLLPEIDSSHSLQSEYNEDSIDDTLNCFSLTEVLYYGLCFILWSILLAIFIKLQFGTVFFILSCLLGIYINTRTTPKRQGEISAYSVFNKDCKSIDGALKAEQFEREIRYGPSAMH